MAKKPIKSLRKKEKHYVNKWLFNGKDFEDTDVGDYVGFVYLLTNLENGMKYIGKKNFYANRKLDGATRRSKYISDWKHYYSSNDEIKKLVKSGVQFKREIISLHTLQRDVNYGEIRALWKYNALEEVDSSGNAVYYNGNISGKYMSELQREFTDRGKFSEDYIF